MKKIVVLLLFWGLLFGSFCPFAQTPKMFYYYKGNQITLSVNSQYFLVYADANKISKELFEKEYRVTEWVEDGSNSIVEAQVSIPNENYDSVLTFLKAKFLQQIEI